LKTKGSKGSKQKSITENIDKKEKKIKKKKNKNKEAEGTEEEKK
jgi:hypothetical protein